MLAQRKTASAPERDNRPVRSGIYGTLGRRTG
jgi:hypothetical protein